MSTTAVSRLWNGRGRESREHHSWAGTPREVPRCEADYAPKNSRCEQRLAVAVGDAVQAVGDGLSDAWESIFG